MIAARRAHDGRCEATTIKQQDGLATSLPIALNRLTHGWAERGCRRIGIRHRVLAQINQLDLRERPSANTFRQT
jgi:hypothetical protein